MVLGARCGPPHWTPPTLPPSSHSFPKLEGAADKLGAECGNFPSQENGGHDNKIRQTHVQIFEPHPLLSPSSLSVRSSQAFTPSTPLRFQSDEFSGGAAAFVRTALALALAASPLCLGLNTALLSSLSLALQSSIQLGWKWRLYITGRQPAMAPGLNGGYGTCI